MNTPTPLSSYEECRNALRFLQGYVFNMNAGGCDPSQAELDGFDSLFSFVINRLDAVMETPVPRSTQEVL